LKWAQTANGFIDDRYQQLAISNPYTKMLNHKLRAEEDAILVGHTTAEREHPKLTVHHWFGPDPKRVILTSYRPLLQVIDDLYQQGIQSLIVEGGLKTHEAFIGAGLYDEIHVETNHQQTVVDGTKAPHLPVDLSLYQYLESAGNTLAIYVRNQQELRPTS
jgi:diaminohydroxyphosphoribosylaminopyrimidine deaminase/5-amino-6-(5-phosphoribosylamino)uracil reductase